MPFFNSPFSSFSPNTFTIQSRFTFIIFRFERVIAFLIASFFLFLFDFLSSTHAFALCPAIGGIRFHPSIQLLSYPHFCSSYPLFCANLCACVCFECFVFAFFMHKNSFLFLHFCSPLNGDFFFLSTCLQDLRAQPGNWPIVFDQL